MILEIQIKGTKEGKKDEILKRGIQLNVGDYLDKIQLNKDLNNIGVYYKQKLLINTQVNYEIVHAKKDKKKIKLIYNIEEGHKRKISRIIFKGNKHFSSEELKNVIPTKSSEYLLHSLLNSNEINMDIVKQSVQMLSMFYQRHSYYAVNITASVVEKNGKLFLIYSINEGAKHIFGTPTVSYSIPNVSDQNIIKESGIYYGKNFDLSELEFAKTKIMFFLRKLGYKEEISVKIEPYASDGENNNVVHVKIAIDIEDKKLVKRIDIEQNYRSEDQAIRSYMLLHENDAYDSITYDQSLDELQDTQNMTDISSEDNVFHRILIREINNKSTKNQSERGLALGVSMKPKEDLGITINAQDKNFLSKPLIFNINMFFGKEKQKSEFKIIRKNFLYSPYTYLGYTLKINNTSHGDADSQKISPAGRGFHNYNEHSIKNRLFLVGFKNNSISYEYGIHYDMYNIQSISKSYFVQKDEGRFFEVGLDWRCDFKKITPTLNPLLNEGIKAGINLHTSFWRKTKYIRPSIEFFGGKEVIHNLYFTSIFRTGFNIPLLEDEIKIFQRFNLGDIQLRGFREEGIGPYIEEGVGHYTNKKINISPTINQIGGNYFYKSSVELVFNLDLIPKNLLIVVPLVFMDIGSVWGVDNMHKYKEVKDVFSNRISVGFAIRAIIAGIGNLEWGYGKPLLKDNNDQIANFYLSLGIMAF